MQTRRGFCVVLILAGILALGGAVSAHEAMLRSEADINRLEEEFLDRFMAGEYGEAFDLFRTGATALSDSELDGLLDTTARQLSAIAQSYGGPIDAVLASREMVSGTLMQRLYILRFQALPLRAQFIYYWNGEVWRLTYFGWDDQYTQFFGE